ncbi:MAG: Ig-like domain-containing protein, partial [Candidatus Thermoplasmatota archaeon]
MMKLGFPGIVATIASAFLAVCSGQQQAGGGEGPPGSDAGIDAGAAADAGADAGSLCDTRGNSPQVAFTSPLQGAQLSGNINISLQVSGDCPIVKVDFFADSASIGSDTSAPWDVTWDTASLANANYTLRAIASDSKAQTGEATVEVFVQQTCGAGDDCPPNVRIVNPAANSTVCGLITLGATATDDHDVPQVTFYLGTDALGVAPQSPYFRDWDSRSVANGDYTIAAEATDTSQNKTRHTIRIRVSNQAGQNCVNKPTVAFASPPPDPQGRPVCVKGTVQLAAEARDDGYVTEVKYAVERNILAGAAPQPPNWNAQWDTSQHSEGAQELKAIAKDNDGLSGEAVLQVQVDRTAPSVTLAVSDAGFSSGGPVGLSVQVSDGTGCGVDRVVYDLTGPEDASVTASTSPYSASWNPTGKPSGAYTARATTYDRAGNFRTSDAGAITLDRPPSLSITSPYSGQTVSGIRTVSVSASDDLSTPTLSLYVDGQINAATFYGGAATWDTTQHGYGSHVLAVLARDSRNQVTDASVTVTVDQPLTVACKVIACSACSCSPGDGGCYCGGAGGCYCDGDGCWVTADGGIVYREAFGTVTIRATVTDDEASDRVERL